MLNEGYEGGDCCSAEQSDMVIHLSSPRLETYWMSLDLHN